MIRKLFIPIIMLFLTFLGMSTVEAMEGKMDDIEVKTEKLLVGGRAPQKIPDETEDGAGSASQAAALPNPHITVGDDGLLCIEGSFGVPGKGGHAPLTVYLRTATDRDFLLGEEEEAPQAALEDLGPLTADECGAYPPHRFGPVTIQRRDPKLMAFYENGTRKPVDTIENHWPNIWKKRLRNISPSTLYVLEERTDTGIKPIGHIGLGHQTDTQWVYFSIFKEEYHRLGIGEATSHYLFGTFLSALYADPIVGPQVAGYTTFLMKMDNESPVVKEALSRDVTIAKIEAFASQYVCPVRHADNKDRPGGRKGHEWVFNLVGLKTPFTPPSSGAAAVSQ